ncbi:hypothetical protein [Natrononativus amylolyticus]|uniref:hypothetical protein n=1 Tax=Natrononativus amylolyticus TaxID=2963434 RepID=UPI0020CE8B67|nr:hypothetical protein [Natrononativus amylolyticus]
MNRRQFLLCSFGGFSVVSGFTGLRYGQAYFGWGAPTFTPPTEPVPWESTVGGRIRSVDADGIVVELTAHRRVHDPFVVAVQERAYPDGEVGGVVHSQPETIDEPGSTTKLSLPLPSELRSVDRTRFYEVFIQRRPDDDGADSRIRFLCESRPYRMHDRSGDSVTPWSRQYAVRPEPETAGVTREQSGSELTMTYTWPDAGDEQRSVEHRIRRSAYDAARGHSRGHVRTYEETISHPEVATLARTIEEALRSSAMTPMNAETVVDAATHFEALVRFVQHLPYGHDQEVLERFDYNRTAEETLVDGMGDCKDKTNLLAGLLEQSRLECNTAFICQPSHIFLGVSLADVPTELENAEQTIEINGRTYLPIESTSPTPLGEYRDTDPITAVYDGEWVYYDPTAVVPIAKSVAEGLLSVHT